MAATGWERASPARNIKKIMSEINRKEPPVPYYLLVPKDAVS